ncbi:MAG: hypothetical protein K5799_15135 [Erythrobacter sp.]|nr:hypothetical protein [Erythrobacter sp.]
MDDRQASTLDAIAFGSNVVDMAYGRLVASLSEDRVSGEAAFADAWTMVDWIYRLDRLVRGARGVPQKQPAVLDFLNGSSLVETHRHTLQHPEATLPDAAASGRSPWGHLSWIKTPRGEPGYTAVVLTPPIRKLGTGKAFKYPEWREPRSPIDWISLFPADGEAEISLTGQHESLVRFMKRLEAAVAASGPPSGGAVLRIVTWPNQ